MIKKILRSAAQSFVVVAMAFAFSPTTSWAQGCDSGCDGGGCGSAVGTPVGCGVASGGGGCDGGGCSGCGGTSGCGGGGCDAGGCGGGCDGGGGGGCGGGCGVGQNLFAGGCGASNDCVCKYTRVFTGWNIVDDIADQNATIGFDDGWAGGIAFGRRNGNRRIEFELSHRHNSFDIPAAIAAADGNLSVASSMTNVLFDLNMIQINDANFYAGAGIGMSYGDIHVLGGGPAEAFDTGFAYQFIAGFDKQLQSGRKAFVEYRYYGTEFDFGGPIFDYEAQNVLFGLEFSR